MGSVDNTAKSIEGGAIYIAGLQFSAFTLPKDLTVLGISAGANAEARNVLGQIINLLSFGKVEGNKDAAVTA